MTSNSINVASETTSFTRLFRGVGALYASTIISLAGRLVFAIIIARWVGADALGVFTIGYVGTQVLSMVALFGLQVGLIHYVSPAFHAGDAKTIRNLFWAGVLTSLFLAIILGAGFWSFISYYHLNISNTPDVTFGLQLYGLTLPAQILITVLGAFGLALNNYWTRVLADRIVPSVVQIPLLALCLHWFSGNVAIALAFDASLAVGAVLAIILIARIYPRGGHVSALWHNTVKLYRYSFMQGLAGIVAYALMNANLFFLGALADSFQVGLYAAASRLTLVGTLFLDAFGQMFAPVAASVKDQVQFKRDFQWVTKWIIVLSSPLFLLLTIFAPVWLTLMGSDFASNSMVLAVLAFSQFLNMLTGASAIAQAMRGRPWLAFINNLLSWGTCLVLTALWASQYKAFGAAVAFLAAIIVTEFLETAECFIFFYFAPFGFNMVRPFGVLLGLALVAQGLYWAFSWNIPGAILVCTVLVLGYALAIWRFALAPGERAALGSILGSLRLRR